MSYWEPWYLGTEPGKDPRKEVPSDKNPRTGPYKKVIAGGKWANILKEFGFNH